MCGREYDFVSWRKAVNYGIIRRRVESRNVVERLDEILAC